MDYQAEAVETLRQLTLQIMLISAGVFGIVGGFVSSSEKKFARRLWLASALLLFSASALLGYLLHGAMISLLSDNKFNAFEGILVWLGTLQIGTFVVGGVCFTVFVTANVSK